MVVPWYNSCFSSGTYSFKNNWLFLLEWQWFISNLKFVEETMNMLIQWIMFKRNGCFSYKNCCFSDWNNWLPLWNNILIEMKAFPVSIKHFLMKMIAFLPNLLKGMIALLIEIKVFLLEMIDVLSKRNYLLKTHFFFKVQQCFIQNEVSLMKMIACSNKIYILSWRKLC